MGSSNICNFISSTMLHLERMRNFKSALTCLFFLFYQLGLVKVGLFPTSLKCKAIQRSLLKVRSFGSFPSLQWTSSVMGIVTWLYLLKRETKGTCFYTDSLALRSQKHFTKKNIFVFCLLTSPVLNNCFSLSQYFIILEQQMYLLKKCKNIPTKQNLKR